MTRSKEDQARLAAIDMLCLECPLPSCQDQSPGCLILIAMGKETYYQDRAKRRARHATETPEQREHRLARQRAYSQRYRERQKNLPR